MNDNNLRNASIQDLVNELKAQNIKKRDIVVPASLMSAEGKKIIVRDPGTNEALKNVLSESGILGSGKLDTYNLELSDTAHNQLAFKLDIPQKYYNKMLAEDGNILDKNINYWFKSENKNYMLRTFDDKNGNGLMRAFLSDRFNIIDNYDILITALEVVKDFPNIKIDACDLTDKRMYVRFYDPSIEIQAPELLKDYRNPGNNNGGNYAIISGFVISNSETGHGTYSISPRGIIKVCNNGLTKKSDMIKKFHVGAKLDAGVIEWSEETNQKNLQLIQSQTKDAIKTFMSKDYLTGVVQWIMHDGQKELNKPIDTVKNVSSSLGLSEEKTDSILKYFLDGKDTSRFGVAQAFTYYAHETTDAEEQYSLEAEVMDLIPVMQNFDKEYKK